MNEELFITSVEKLNIQITDQHLILLDKYYNLLKQWNKKMNLTSITEKKDVYLKHFYDSLTICKYLDLSKYKNIIDVGSGAGFPGIVLKIFFDDIYLDIIDSNNKKIVFLENVISNLNLENVNLIHDRAEIYAKNNIDKYDLCLSRAVANLNILSELCLPLVKKNGYFVAYKAATIEEELCQSKQKITKLGGKIDNVYNFLLPIENSKRSILVIKKIKVTPIGFPRSYDKIIKNN